MSDSHGDDRHSVCGVLVTYRADPATLRAALGAIRPQLGSLVVVDNGTSGLTELVAPFDAVVLHQEGNVGLAAAQNAGIAWARTHGADHVLLLDQDSVADPSMVRALLDTEREQARAGRRVGAVGPVFTDPRTGHTAPFVHVAFPRSEQIFCGPDRPTVEADFLISSGALIPMAVLDEVGDMDASLFIDNIDMEWSFRARSKGFTLLGTCAGRLAHELGDSHEPVLWGRATVVKHGPERLYFIMRNRVELYRRPYTPRVWIAQDVIRIPFKFAIFALLVGPRTRNVRYMLRGLLDGVRRRSGPCSIGAAR